MKRLDEISNYINQLPFDLKAEMLLAVLSNQMLNHDNIIAAFDGQLKRVWSKDIAGTNVEQLETGDEKLVIHLNRDGIYDILPEAIFHKDPGHEDQSGEDMAKDSMRSRTEEKEARSFFQPFENEIFLLGFKMVLKENQLFKSLFSEFLTGIVPSFWNIPHNLPEDYVLRLKKLLPLIHQITGDLNLTAQCLEYILQECVFCSSNNYPPEENGQEGFSLSGVLDKSMLGIDTISGGHVDGFIKNCIFSIGPIKKPETSEFVKNGIMTSFLGCFYDYFIPFELDVETRFLFEKDQSFFKLPDDIDTDISYLGINSVIL